ncbi:MAG: hypothetical protein A3K04_01015 [Gallionellales bacterium RBG_16_56_9]|nr:MAG: hypothetical protein A3K04_01015 [Gallionellales bacterium RBG_16_56_9]
MFRFAQALLNGMILIGLRAVLAWLVCFSVLLIHFLSAFGFCCFSRQQAGELLVALEQELYPLRVTGECGFAVAGKAPYDAPLSIPLN